MSNVRETVKIVAATAALTPLASAFLGGQAMAKTTFPSVKDVATQINALPNLKKGSGNKQGGPSVYYQGRLPRGQRVSLSFTSKKNLHGKPDPQHATALDIEIYKPIAGKGSIKPFITVDFLKGADGTWTAHEQQAIPTRPNSIFSVEELGQRSANQQVTTVLKDSQVIVSQASSLGGQCAAEYVLKSLAADAYNTLDYVANNEAVPLSTVGNYAAIGHIGC